ncbi:hypothetical protein EKG38_13465 [Shewanella canadensis]|uniref:Uncharacterized protein n=2 Tax=Shewanella canadensis TaxID=271096 RepID=A0A431WSM1_9GAMM|nr:hypothetical protein EKG38_13465 [Shewanella canadensis]
MISGIIIIAAITVSGYGTVDFDDVSTITPYSEVVGLIVTSKEKVILHGWTEADHTVEHPVFYSFSLPPGTDNRFVKSRTTIPAGLRLEIVAVEKCKNCYLDLKPRIKFRVNPRNLKTDHDLPIYLNDSFLVEEWGENNEPITYDYSVFLVGS